MPLSLFAQEPPAEPKVKITVDAPVATEEPGSEKKAPSVVAPVDLGDDAASSETGQSTTKQVKKPFMDRFEFSGYFRVAGRYDGGNNSSTLGWWNAYGRLMNETTWITLQFANHVVLPEKKDDPRATVVMRIEGGSIRASDDTFGSLDNYRFTQVYLETEHVALDNFVTQTGTLWYNMGYIGIYDFYVSQLFWETVGIRAGQRFSNKLEYFAGIGDSGYEIYADRRSNEPVFYKGGYNAVPTAGTVFRINLAQFKPTKDAFFFSRNFWVGLGFQVHSEPENSGNPNAPLQTPGIEYEEVLRGETLKNYLKDNPDQEQSFPNPEATSVTYFKAVANIGFDLKYEFGPVHLKWNDLSFSLVQKRPDTAIKESYDDVDKTIYISEFTDERFEVYLVDEMQFQILPKYLDLNIGLLYSEAWDNDNELRPDDNNRRIFGAVIRPQFYFTRELHALLEVSMTREVSTVGNRYREHYDSIESSADGFSDERGLEWGDTEIKDTFQIKLGPVLNPNGRGIYNRPSIRLLFGAQYSNVHAAFGNTRDSSLTQENIFSFSEDRHWHYMVSLEAEHWWGSY